MKELYRKYLMNKGLSRITIGHYLSSFNRFEKWRNNPLLNQEVIPYSELTVEHIRSYLSVHRYSHLTLWGIKSFFEFLFYEELVDENICEVIETPAKAIRLPNYLTIDEMEQLFKYADTREKTVLHLMWSTGMRIGEVDKVVESDLLIHSRLIKIHGKGNKERWGVLYTQAAEYLSKWLLIKHRAKLKTFWGIKAGKLFVEFRKKIPDEKLRNKLNRPHILRHTFATHMIAGGANIVAVAELMGHESIITTEKYVHLSGHQIRDAILIGMGGVEPKNNKKKKKKEKKIKSRKLSPLSLSQIRQLRKIATNDATRK